MSEILVNTIKKADGTGSITVPNETGTVVTTGGSSVVTSAMIASSVALGITEFDSWRLRQDNTYNNGSVVDSYWERADTDDFAKLGTGMSQSSGVFTFPSTGYWLVHFVAQASRTTAATDGVGMGLQHTTDNSNWLTAVESTQGVGTNQRSVTSGFHFVKISDTSNDKVRFIMATDASSGTKFFGSTDRLKTGAYFVKIAEI